MEILLKISSKIKKPVSVFLIILIISIAFFGFAANNTEARELELDWPATPMGTTLKPNSTIVHLVQYFFEWAISLGGLAGFIALIIAGFLYLTSTGDPNKMKEAKDRIVSVFLGLALLFGSYLILTIIDPELVELRPPVMIGPREEMPVFTPPGAVPRKRCEKVIFYPGFNQSGSPGIAEYDPLAEKIGCHTLGKGKTINSLKISPHCKVMLFNNINCKVDGKDKSILAILSNSSTDENMKVDNIKKDFRILHDVFGIQVWQL